MISIDTDVPPPVEAIPVKRGRGRPRKIVADTDNPATAFLNALKFISPTQKKKGSVSEQFAYCGQGWLVAGDESFTMAHPFQEDIRTCPQTFLLAEALSYVTDEVNFIQQSQDTLIVEAGKYRGSVPCVQLEALQLAQHDPMIGPCGDSLRIALDAVLPLVSDTGHTSPYAGVLIDSGTACSASDTAILEAWHGVPLPTFLIPRRAAHALAKAPRVLVGFGYSPNSVTFYFDNGAFLKTRLMNVSFPNYKHIFDNPVVYQPIPEQMFEAIGAVSRFNTEGNVYFEGNTVSSSRHATDKATTYEIAGLPEKMGFRVKELNKVKKAFKNVHFDTENCRVFFCGDNVRGVMTALDLGAEVSYESTEVDVEPTDAEIESMVNDVPF